MITNRRKNQARKILGSAMATAVVAAPLSAVVISATELAAFAAYNGAVYGVDYLTSSVYSINTATGVATTPAIGTLTFASAGIASQPGSNLIYYTEYKAAAGGTYRIGTFNISTGANVTLATASAAYLPRMAFRSDGTLWAMEGNTILHQVNTTTGAYIGSAITLTTTGATAMPAGGGDIAFAPDGTMYVAVGTGLFKAVPTAGVYSTYTYVGATGIAAGSITGIELGTGGTLLVSVINGTASSLYSVNSSTGVATAVGSGFGGTVVIADLAVLPDLPPVAVNDSVTTPGNTAVTVTVRTNDSDPDADPLTVTSVTNGTNGTVAIVGGNPVYTPNPTFHGTDTFTYTISDGNGGTATATVTVTVQNRLPIAVNDSVSTAGNTAVTVSVLANDSDPNGDPLTVTSVTSGTNGTVAIVGGLPVYTPNAAFRGVDTFTYTISDGQGGTATATVTVTVANRPPVAVADTVSTPVDTAVTVSVLTNDSDPNGDPITVTAVTNGLHGTVAIVSGLPVFTPAAGYSGTDSFTYTISDGQGGTATATVNVSIKPTTANDTGTTPAGIVLNGTTVLSNDLGTGLTVTANGAPAHGTVTVAANGTYVYTPTAGYSGPDSFTYTATDSAGSTSTATVNLIVTPRAVNNVGTTPAGSALSGASVLTNDFGSGLSVTSNTAPAHGTVTIASNGTYTYTPAAGYSGPDSFTYTATDASGRTTTATVNLTVTPVAVNNVGVTNANVVLNGASVIANDLGSTLTVTSNTAPLHGTVTVAAGGTYVYTPTTNYTGPDSFTYTVTDGSGQTATATVNITVGPGPVNDAGTTPANTALNGSTVLSNDIGTGLSVTANTAPAHGTVTIASNGTYIYTPTTGYSGPDSFTYTVTDSLGNTGIATVNLTVTPRAITDTASTPAGTTLSGTSVLGNDVGTTLAVTANTAPLHGTVTVASNGTYTYVPAAGYSGPDSFSYTIRDASGQTTTGTVNIAVTPRAVADSGTTPAGTPLSGTTVLSNDLGSGLTVTANTAPSHGTVTIAASGTYVYTPAAGYSGPDSFTYTVTDSSGQTNTTTVTIAVAPKAVNNTGTTPANTTLAGASVLGNDLGSGLTVTSNTAPTHGTVTVAATGTYSYSPTTGYSGPDSFTYTVTDSAGQTSTATVNLTVTPTSANDSASVAAGSVLNGTTVLSNDVGSTLTVTSNTAPSHGTVSVATNGTYTYTPTAGYSGPDTFTYTATDGSGQTTTATVTIAVTPVAANNVGSTPANTALNGTSVLTNDKGTSLTVTANSAPSHGTVTIAANGTYTYTPTTGYSGLDSFTYTATDASGQTTTATVTITVGPVTFNDSVTTPVNTTLNGSSVLTNDVGTGLTVTSNTATSHGTVTVAANGTFTYVPTTNYSGPDTFTYTATDSNGTTSTASVSIAVTPKAFNDASSVPANATLIGTSVLTNDKGSSLTVTGNSSPAHGSVSVSANGTYTYTPTSNYSGPDSFTYTATDAAGQTTTATVTLTVTPLALNNSGSTTTGVVLNGASVLANDAGSGLTVASYTSPSHGTVTVASNGTYTYTPFTGYSGLDSFTYTAIDASGQTSTATVILSVNPLAVNNAGSTPADTVLNGTSVLTNDVGTGLTVTGNTAPGHGTVTVAASGVYTYTPTSGYSGPDSFTYTATDSSGLTSAATVFISVTPRTVNDAGTTIANTTLNGTSVLSNDSGSALSVTSSTAPAHGTVTVAPAGTYVYTPTAGYSGPDSFTYTATDAAGQTSTATVNLTVTPKTMNDTATTNANTTLNGTTVLANDAGTSLTVTSNTSPLHGTVTVAANGTYVYTPTAGYSGPDSFTYTVTDASGQKSVASVSITVKPTAANDTASTVVNTVLNGSTVLVNDAGSGLTVTANTSPSHGTVTIAASGTYVYTPTTGYSGADSFTYTTTDSTGQTATATVNITVTPLAVDNVGATVVNTVLNGTSLLTNDLGTGLTVTSNTAPAHGTVTVAANGTYTYTPTANYSGADSFTYTVTDGNLQSSTATVTLTITPLAVNNTGVTNANVTLAGASVLANDGGSGLTVTANTAPSHGTVTVAANGTYTYVPASNYSGPDSFGYTATDAAGQTTSALVNLTVKPVAIIDTASTLAGVTLNGASVLVNDGGSTLTVTSNTAPSHGTVTVAANGTYMYTPTANYSGPDSFTYTITDATGQTSTSAVNVTVTPVATADTGVTPANIALNGSTVLVNDLGSGLTVTGNTAPSHGTVTVAANGTYTYAPAANYSGADSFTYTVTDASGQSATTTVTLTVNPVAANNVGTTPANTALSAPSVLTNDAGTGLTVIGNTSPAHGTVTIAANGTYVYTPATGYSGPDSFSYTATDSSGHSTVGIVNLTVTVVATDDSGTTPANTLLSGSTVLANDIGTTLTVTGHTSPTHGTVTIAANGTYIYTPAANYSGPDSFSYTATDASGQTATASVSLTVSPTSGNDTGSTLANVALNGATVLANDAGTGLTVTGHTVPSHGSVVINADGTYTYTPALNYSGPDSFTYTTTDAFGQTATSSVALTVTPVAANNAALTQAGVAYNGPSVLANDAGTSLTVTAHSTPGHGTLTIGANGKYLYTPAAGYSGPDSFTYTATDASGQTTTAIVYVTVVPSSGNDNIVTPANTAISGPSLLLNDGGSGLTVTANTSPAHGTVTVAANGTYTYTPAPGYAGTDSFTYTATDSAGQTTTATVSIVVGALATNDTGLTPANTAFNGSSVLTNDLGVGLTVTGHTSPAHGTVVIQPDGTYVYTPAVDFSGFDSFTYTTTDAFLTTSTATVSLTVTPTAVNDVALLLANASYTGTSVTVNDAGSSLTVSAQTPPTHGSLTIASIGTYTYTPNPGYSGPDSFVYAITDAAGQVTSATVYLTIKPVAVNDSGVTPAGTTLNGPSVLANDAGTTLTVTSNTSPTHGTVAVASNGTYAYVPAAGYSGSDSFTYTATDAFGRSTTAIVTITVNPVTYADTGATPANTPLLGASVLTNDVGTGLTVTSNTAPSHGTVTVASNGTYTYTPTTGYSGPDAFSYTATDAAGHTSSSTVTITVNPVAIADNATTAANTALTGSTVLANDLGTGLTVTSNTAPSHGTVSVAANGTYVYTPATGYSGPDSFSYTVTDASGHTSTAIVTLAVTPTAVGEAGTTTTNTALSGSTVLSNDVGTGLTVTSNTAPSHGTVTVAANGTYVYTPFIGYSGPDSFTYIATDASGQTTSAAVSINVFPTGSNDTGTTPANTVLNGVTVLGNDIGTGLAVTSHTSPTHGTVTIAANGTYVYTPATNYSGPDTFTYTTTDASAQTATSTVTITVTPVATNDAALTTVNTVLHGASVLSGDAGTGLTVTAHTNPAHGTLSISTNGTYTYTPAAGYSGPDSFNYTATDASGQLSTATVNLTVTPVAANDAFTTPANTPKTGTTLLANDGGSALTVTAHTSPAHGTLTINSDGTYTYTPATGYAGLDSFTYTVTDASGQTSTATVTITVGAQSSNDLGTTPANTTLNGASVLSNDVGVGLTVTGNTAPTHGTVTVASDGTYVYTPVANYSGADSFVYIATDSFGTTSSSTVNINVTPVAANDTGTTPAQTPLTSTVLGNDAGSSLTVTATTAAGHGTVVMAANGTYTYTPFAGFSGPDSFTYTATDGAGNTTTATVSISVTPVAVNDAGVTPANTPLSGASVLANDPGVGLLVTAHSNPLHGTLAINPDGTYLYTPAANFSGSDSFTYTATDAAGNTANATVTLTVNPVASPDSAVAISNTPFNGPTVLANDAGTGLTVTGSTAPMHGSVTVAADGTYVYTPAPNYSGPDSFTYTATDTVGHLTTTTVNLTVNPLATNDVGSTSANTVLNGSSVLTNDGGLGLTVTGNTAPSHGTVTVAANGTYTYVPTTNYSGPDSFSYTATDAAGHSTTATVNLTIVPTAINDTGSTSANTALNGSSVLANDLGSGLTVTTYGAPGHGTVTVAVNGTYAYTPAIGFSGADSFTYTAIDGAGHTSTATVALTVNPTAASDSATTPANTTLAGSSVLANDVGSSLTVTSFSPASHGTVTVAANGTYTYTPATGYSGADSFTYTTTDAAGHTATATVALMVTPIALADSGTTVANSPYSGTSVLTADIGTGLTVTGNTNPSHGTVSMAANGTYVYTPAAGYSGPDSFTYTATDAAGQSTTATVTMTVTPKAVNDAVTTAANTPVNGSTVLANDAGSSLHVVGNSAPAHGTVTVATDGTYTYAPASGYAGPDSFTYTVIDAAGQTTTATVSVTVGALAGNDTGTTSANTPLNGSTVLANDLGVGLTVTSHTNPAHGTVVIQPDGTYVYTPAAGFSGFDSFTYTTTDTFGTTSTAAVSLTVTPTAGADSNSTAAQTPVNGTVLGNDVGSNLTVTGHTSPAHGSLTITPAGTYTYTPAPGFSGVDSFTYVAKDAAGQSITSTVSIRVTPVAVDDAGATLANTPLSGSSVLANDPGIGLTVTGHTAPSHGTVTINTGGTYVYTPAVGFSGVDSFTYTATDAGGFSSTATVHLTVNPIGVDDAGTTSADTPLNGSTVLTNDIGVGLSVSGHTAPAHGTVTVAANGTYVYTPATGYSGPDSFTYTVTDGAGLVSTATVTLTVNPVAKPDTATVAANTPLSGSTVLVNDIGTGLTVTGNTAPTHGTVTVNPDGTYVYSPAAGYSGPDSFSYTVTDAAGHTSTATVTVSVTPTAANDTGATPAETALNGTSVLANDIGTGLTVTSTTNPAHGTVVMHPDGTYVYTPNSGFSGDDSFTYTTTDAAGHVSTATVSLAVNPTAIGDIGATQANTPLLGASVLSNDIGTGLTVTANTGPIHGTVVMATNGTYTYTPNTGYSGRDSFTYTAIDASGRLSTAVVDLQVLPGAADDTSTTPANTTLNGSSLLGNDTGVGLTVIGHTNPNHGSLVMNPDGTYIYTPNPGYSGPDSFRYTVQDSAGFVSNAGVNLTVTPTAANDLGVTSANTALNGASVLTNDVGTGLTVTGMTAPTHGTASISPDGTYVYRPDANYSGPDSFTYSSVDAAGHAATATVSILVTPKAAVNTGAVATNGVLSGPSVLTNDAGSGLIVTGNTDPSHGTLVVTPSGTYTYTPAAGYSGTDSFTYTATDANGQTTTATVTITVSAIAVNDTGTTSANTALVGASVLTNDAGSGLHVTGHSAPLYGTVVMNPDGTYVYTPTAGFSGVDTFTYDVTDASGRVSTASVTIGVTPVAEPDTVSVVAGSPLVGTSLLANDIGSGLTASTTITSVNPAHGTLVLNPDGTFVYTPNPGYSGLDSFNYTVTDSSGQTSSATVTLSIAPKAFADSGTTAAGTPLVSSSVLANDLGTGLVATVATPPSHGTLVMNPDGTYTYTPGAGYSGPDSFTYTATDTIGQTTTATVALMVTPTAVADSGSTSANVALSGASVLTNDLGTGLTITNSTAPTHGTVTLNANGTYIYVPTAGYSGLDSFTYTITDAYGHTNTATVSIVVNPRAVNDVATTPAGSALNAPSVLANDLGVGLTVTSNTAPSHGTVTIVADGTYAYTPATGYSGPDSFTYTATDAAGNTSTATVVVTVTPRAVGDIGSTAANTALIGSSVLANDLGSGLTVTSHTAPSHGTVTMAADGAYIYVPTAGYSGPDSFTYTVTDTVGQTTTSTVSILVRPKALADSATTAANTALFGSTLLVNDLGSSLTATAYSAASHGTVTVFTNGTYSYTPFSGYSGPDAFTYTVTDASGSTSTAVVSITVNPVAIDDTAATASNVTLNGSGLLGNDIGSGLTITGNTAPSHGTVVVNADGTYVYVPAANYSGPDSFTYTATDASGLTSTATVAIAVGSVAMNDTGTTTANTVLVGSSVLANDAGTGLSVTSNTAASHGTVVVHADGTYVYTPATNYSGPDSFTYTSTDSAGHTSTATVSLTIAPTATDNTGSTVAGSALNGFSVLANDAGTGLSVASSTAPSHGTVTVAVNGSYVYTPAAGYSGPDSFTYTATDASGQTTVGVVHLIVTPLVVGNIGTTSADTVLNGTSVLINDSGSGLTAVLSTAPSHGTVVVASNGTYAYTPAAGYSGPDSFTYTATDASGQNGTATVTLTVTPTAAADSATTAANSTLIGSSVLVNDLGSGLTVTGHTSPSHGTVAITSTGTYTYVPAAGYSGPDSFTYTVTDASGQTSSATVSVTVGPRALNDTATTPSGTALTGTSVLANDLGSSLTVTANTAPAHGTLVMNTDGTYLYTPTAGYSGPDTFTYTTTDATGQTATAIVTIAVKPVSTNDSATVAAGTSLTGTTVLGNDAGTSLTVTSSTSATHGVVVIGANGTYTYTPAAGYSGPDAFTYTVTDASGQTSTATVSITVTPVATGDIGVTPAGAALAGTVLGNDLGTSLTVTAHSAATHGSLTIAATGSYTYTPVAGYSGPDSFTYTTTDASGQTSTATVTLTVNPVAVNDSSGTAVNTTLNGSSVLANDLGFGLTVTANTAPAHGTLVMNTDGTYVYTPTTGYSGTDSFTYTTTDAAGHTAVATVSLGIGSAALPDTASTPANTPLAGASVLANDLGTGLVVTSSTPPSHGTLSMHPDGTYTYTPAAGYSGPDTFTYTTTDASGQTATATVTLTVTPTAASDTAAVVAGATVTGNVLANDAGTGLTVLSNTAAAHGTVVVNPDGTFSYTPLPGYSGPDSFTYTVIDSAGQTTTATVTINVVPAAVGDTGTTPANTPLVGSTLLGNDAGAGLTVTAHTAPSHGTVAVAANGTYTYTPTAGYSGPDGFTYTATDAAGNTTTATVSIDVTPTTAADTYSTTVSTPLTGTSVLGNDVGSGLYVVSATTPAHGTLSMHSDGSFVYTPSAGYSGPDSFTYTVKDASGQVTTATATISVGLTVRNDTGTVAAGTTLNGTTLLSNDSGTALTVTANTAASHGTVVVNSDGTYAYTPTAGYSGTDTFTYTVTDASGLTATASVVLVVTPVTSNDSAAAVSGVALSAPSLLGNDLGTSLTVASNTSPAHGSLLMQPNGTYLYTPTAGYSGTDSFAYTATDANGQSSTSTVTVTVSPKAVADTVSATAGSPLVGASVLANDLGVGLTVTSAATPAHGTVAMNSDGTYTYTPAAGFSGPDSFTYTVTDAAGNVSTATVTVTVNPTAVADTAVATANTALVGSSVLANDLGVGLTVTSSTNPAHGLLVMNPDGTYSYTPANGFSGPDSFTYTATDAAGHTTTATVSINVQAKAIDDAASTVAGSPVTINVTANDLGVGLVVTSVTQPAPALGAVAIVGGKPVFTPAPGTSGPVTFTYTVADAAGNTSTAIVTVSVTPKAVADPRTTPVSTTLVGASVLANDAGTGLTVTGNTNPAHGTLVMNPDGTFTYTPTAGYSGPDSFTYTATDASGQTVTGNVTIAVGTAALPDSATVAAGSVLTGTSVLTNDGGSGISVTSTTPPTHGTLAMNADGTYAYTPTAGYSGPDSFTYTITDTFGQTSTATVSLSVTPVAHDDTATTSASTPLHGATVFTNDAGAGLTVTSSTMPTHGSLVMNPDGTYIYTPTANYSGPDSFTYTVTDASGQTSTATVTLSVAPTASDDTASVVAGGALAGPSVLGNDSGSGLTVTANTTPAHGTLVMNSDGTYSYTPAPGYSGNDMFTYTVTDLAGNTATAMVTIAVQPKAMPDSMAVVSGVQSPGSLMGNDIGVGLAVTSYTQPAHGTVVINPDGTSTFTANPAYSGPDAFTYTVTDAAGHTSTTTVTVTIAPKAMGDTATAKVNTPLVGSSVLANDTGAGLTVTGVTTPAHGTVFMNPDGTYTYTPATGYSGPDSFVYTVTDASGQTSTATVVVNVGNVAVNDTASLSAGQSANIAVLANDSGTGLTVTAVGAPQHGTATVNPDGTITYTPAPGFSGRDVFTYSVTDASGQTVTATVTVDVKPVGQDVSTTTAVSTKINIQIIGANGGSFDPTTLHVTTQPAHGTVTVNADGTVTYTPAPGYTGVDTFVTEVMDSQGNRVLQTVTVNVRGARPLPRTGSNTEPLLDAAAGLVALGAVMTAAGRRRRRRIGDLDPEL